MRILHFVSILLPVTDLEARYFKKESNCKNSQKVLLNLAIFKTQPAYCLSIFSIIILNIILNIFQKQTLLRK